MTGTGFGVMGMKIDGYIIILFIIILCAFFYILIRRKKGKNNHKVDKQAGDEGED